MLNFRNFTTAVVFVLTVTSAPALAESSATLVGQVAQAQMIESLIALDDVSPVRTQAGTTAWTDGRGGVSSKPVGEPVPNASVVDDPNQPETATGLDLKGPSRRFPNNQAPE
jgi:hypothetical protein